MRRRFSWKHITLVALLLVFLLAISGCFSKPDKVDEVPVDSSGVLLPFATDQPTPTPGPTDAGQGLWETDGPVDPGSTGGTSSATNAPIVTQPVVQTASPTPIPAWTYSPQPTTAPTATTKPADGTLRNGDTGSEVKTLQQRLKDLGYYTGSVDGTFGAGTESALKAFQRASGLSADGIMGSQTKSALNSSSAKPKATTKPTSNGANATNRPTPKTYTPSTLNKYRYLQLGSSGNDVKKLQQKLKDLGYYNGSVNGNFGDDTEAAVIAFQKRNGLYYDGVAGEDTQNLLYSSDALPVAKGGSIAVPGSTTTGYRMLKSGLEGDDVSLLQTRLKEMGYYAGDVDGKYGDSTAEAIKLFQQTNGLTVDGTAGTSTQARIYSSNALYAPVYEVAQPAKAALTDTMELGSMGDTVYSLQERLYDLGYYTGRIDGIYSDAVVLAVKAFQTANKITADGKAGRTTQTKIYSENAIAAAGAQDNTYATLKQGDTGERVRALQGLLTTYGYYDGTIDGTYGLSTVFAVQELQATNELTPDGVAGPATLQLLYQGSPVYAQAKVEAEPKALEYETLKRGMESPDVMMMQQFLQEMGYYTGEQNGIYDGDTLLAVQAFQQKNGLNADGIAGNETLVLLYSGTAEVSDNLYAATAQTPERDTMREGDEGQDVFDLQTRLAALGYLTSTPDGQYGSGTKTAVTAFQTKNGLKADGIAGKETVSAMYLASVIMASGSTADIQLEAVSNRARELQEQESTGAIQASISGGGVAASYNSNIYYAGKSGTLYMRSSSTNKQVYDGKASFIHASGKGVTFVSGNSILRIPLGGGKAETLAKVSNLKKMTAIGDTLIYQEGSTLVRLVSNVDPQTLMTSVNDYTLDVFQYTAYVASSSGVKKIGLNGSGELLLVSTPADQVQLADSVVFFRSSGNIYRLEDGISVLVKEADATWMGIYRDKVYYISGGSLYACDTDGQNAALFYDGKISDVSFVAGKVYVTATKGGEVTEIIEVVED